MDLGLGPLVVGLQLVVDDLGFPRGRLVVVVATGLRNGASLVRGEGPRGRVLVRQGGVLRPLVASRGDHTVLRERGVGVTQVLGTIALGERRVPCVVDLGLFVHLKGRHVLGIGVGLLGGVATGLRVVLLRVELLPLDVGQFRGAAYEDRVARAISRSRLAGDLVPLGLVRRGLVEGASFTGDSLVLLSHVHVRVLPNVCVHLGLSAFGRADGLLHAGLRGVLLTRFGPKVVRP